MDDKKLREIVWEPGVIGILEKLGDREVHVLYYLACRLAQGQRLFGRLTPKKRDWVKDLVEENADNSLYSIFHLIDLADGEDSGGTP